MTARTTTLTPRATRPSASLATPFVALGIGALVAALIGGCADPNRTTPGQPSGAASGAGASAGSGGASALAAPLAAPAGGGAGGGVVSGSSGSGATPSTGSSTGSGTGAGSPVASGVPVSIDLQPFTPGFTAVELRASGVLDVIGPFPVRYRIDFCAPPQFAAVAPAPIVGNATGPKVQFVAPFTGRPATGERFVIDVVVTIVDGPNAGKKIRDRTGLVVNPSGAESGLRGSCGGELPLDAK